MPKTHMALLFCRVGEGRCTINKVLGGGKSYGENKPSGKLLRFLDGKELLEREWAGARSLRVSQEV